MSLPLADLLNPAPSPRPSPPRALAPIQYQSPEPTQSHTYSSHTAQPYVSQSHTTESPESYHAQSFGSRQGSFSSTSYAPPAAITSSYEAASALTALATSGAQSHYGSYTYSHSPPSRDHFSPIATSSYPPPYDSSRRQSAYAPVELSPILDHPPTQLSPATTLDRYHHTPSHSPEQQFPSRFESGPVLAPLGQHARTTPPQGLHGSTTAYPGQPLTPLNNNLLSDQQSDHQDHIASQDANYNIQTRDSSYLPQETLLKKVPIPSNIAPIAKMETPAPEPIVEHVVVHSPPHIKDEPSETPGENTPAQTTAVKESSPAVGDLDSDTLAAIEAAKNESGFSFRDRSSKTKTSIEDTVPSATSAAMPTTEGQPTKKRPAPPRNRKGMASTIKKPAAKRRKIESEPSVAGSNVRRSATPNSHNGTLKTPGLRGGAGGKQSASQTPAGSSPAPEFIDDGASEVGSDDSSGEVFCVCRKGDNHTYMIACDGGCEDWFHGKCVDILEEDGDLIDKYICPACHEKSGSVTTWLPMCRRDGCRKPARLKKGSASKYCSDECGVLFMQGLVEKSAGGAGSAGAGNAASMAISRRNRRKANRADHDGNEGDSDDDDLGPRGGALRPSELKALVLAAPNITSFRALGDGVLSPPATISPTSAQFPDGAKVTKGTTDPPYTLNPAETQTIASFEEKKVQLRLRRELLREREKFVGMTREQVQRYAEREGIKPKDVCGYDSRLAWPEETFDKWRKSPKGLAALKMGTLDVPETMVSAMNGATPPKSEDGVEKTIGDIDVEKEVQMCTRKRCERHRLWQKQALSDVRFEESTLADEMRGLEAEEKEVREGAMLRWRKEVGGAGGKKEGWVEVAEPLVHKVENKSLLGQMGDGTSMMVDP
ncbi:MAGE-domain-containing protein [Venturia nashicola]|uniref:MAGE-domain-containing protein n=1 Tax=Venturia nashicola TaxID=86259 RepID=A0A4Z1PFK9_9PEZI|nr:MAGE-domain-containing protein [Venturia nashicola]TLD36630.1 MAGE-domain-containing protein [Venturia nashicola]